MEFSELKEIAAIVLLLVTEEDIKEYLKEGSDYKI